MARDRADGAPDPLGIRAEWTPDRTAVVEATTGEAVSYDALDRAADTVASVVDAESDGAVGLSLGTRMAVPALAFGTLRAGRRAVLVDASLPASALAARLEGLDVDLLLCEADTEGAAVEPDAPTVLSVDELATDRARRIDPFDPASPGEGYPAEDDGELVAFTSGTTGDPKAVRLPMTTLVASAVASGLRLGVDAEDRWLVPIPTCHVGGFSPLVRCTLAGTTAVLQREFDAAATIEAVDAHDVTCLSLVPTQLSRLLDRGWNPPDRVRFVLLGGGPIPPSLIERCRERDVPVCPTYGTTETASQVATALPESAFAHPDSVGWPLALTTVTVVDDGERCDADEVGEIVVDGATVTPGYLDDARTAEAFDDVGFHTGDLGWRDSDGRLYVEGRADDVIVTGGENVSAGAVEDVLESHPSVEEAVVVGVPDPEWGERVSTLVVSDDLAPEALRSYAREDLPPYAVPKTVEVTDTLPRTPSGTVDRSRVLERFD